MFCEVTIMNWFDSGFHFDIVAVPVIFACLLALALWMSRHDR
jgi:hypothetical protein